MADSTLKARIALEGGDDVKATLAGVGQASEAAFQKAQSGATQAGTAVNVFRAILADVQQAAQTLSANIESAFTPIGHVFDPLAKAGASAIANAARVGGSLATVAAGAGVIRSALAGIGQAAADNIAKVKDVADAVGLSLEKYRALKAGLEGAGLDADILEKMGAINEKAARNQELKGPRSHFRKAPGTEADDSAGDGAEAVGNVQALTQAQTAADLSARQLSAGIRANSADLGDFSEKASETSRVTGKLTESILGAERETAALPRVWSLASDGAQAHTKSMGGLTQAARELHVSLTDMFGRARANIDISRDVVAALGQMEDGSKRTDLITRAYGESLGKQILAYADNRAAIEANRAAVERAGPVLSATQQQISKDVRATGTAVAEVAGSWKDYLGVLAAPIALDVNNWILKFLADNRDAIQGFIENYVKPAIVWLGQFQNAFGTLAIAVGALGGAFGLLPGLASLGLIGAGAGFVFFWDQIKSGAQNAAGFVRDHWRAALDAVVGFMRGHDFTSWDGIKQAASDAFAAIRAFAVATFSALGAELQGSKLGDLWGSLRAGAVQAWEAVKAYALAAWGEIGRILASNDLSTWGGWKNAATQAFDDIVAVCRAAFSRVQQIAVDGYLGLRAAALSAFPGLAGVWTQFEQLAAKAFASLKSVSGSTWLAIAAALLPVVLFWGEGLAGLVLGASAAWRAIGLGARELAPALGASLEGAVARAGGAFESIGALGRAAWTYLRALFSGDKALQGEAFAGLRAAARVVWEDVKAAFATGVRAIRGAIEEAFPGAGDFFAGIERGAQALWTAVKVLAAEFAGFLFVISGGKIKLSGLEAGILLVGLQLTGLMPVLFGVVGFFGRVIEAAALFGYAIVLAIRTVLPVFGLLGRAMIAGIGFAIANPMLTAIILLIAALAAGVYELYQHWDQVKAASLAAWEAMKTGGAAAWEWTKQKASDFWTWLGAKWDDLKTAATRGWDAVKDAAAKTWEAVKKTASDSLTAVGESGAWKAIAGAWDKIKDKAASVWTSIEAAASGAAERVGKFISGAVDFVTGAASGALERANAIAAAISKAIDATKTAGGAGDLAEKLVAPFNSALPQIQAALTGVSQAVESALRVVSQVVEAFPANLSGLAGGLEQALEKPFDLAAAHIAGVMAGIIASVDAALAKLQQLGGAAGSANSGATSSQGGGGDSGDAGGASVIRAATGGHVVGPGTGTSDSILARLSNNEFVMSAKAVSKWGVGLLHSLNNLTFPGFAAGGLVDAGASLFALPRFADGGLVGVGAPIFGDLAPAAFGDAGSSRAQRLINFSFAVGDKTFDGFTGPEKALDALERHSAALQMAAAGRSPSRVR